MGEIEIVNRYEAHTGPRGDARRDGESVDEAVRRLYAEAAASNAETRRILEGESGRLRGQVYDRFIELRADVAQAEISGEDINEAALDEIAALARKLGLANAAEYEKGGIMRPTFTSRPTATNAEQPRLAPGPTEDDAKMLAYVSGGADATKDAYDAMCARNRDAWRTGRKARTDGAADPKFLTRAQKVAGRMGNRHVPAPTEARPDPTASSQTPTYSQRERNARAGTGSRLGRVTDDPLQAEEYDYSRENAEAGGSGSDRVAAARQKMVDRNANAWKTGRNAGRR